MIDKSQMAILKYQNEKKSVLVAYILYFFFGFWLQAHRFYAGNKLIGFFLFLCPIIGFAFLYYNPEMGHIGMVFLGIWSLAGMIDLFYIPIMVQKANAALLSKIEQK